VADSSNRVTRADLVRSPSDVAVYVDAAIDVAARSALITGRTVVALGRLGRPFAELALRPPVLPESWWPYTRLLAMARRGRRTRAGIGRVAVALTDETVPRAIDVVLDRIDLTQIVMDRVALREIVAQVLDVVDVDAVVATVDLDAVVDRIDIDAIAAKIDLDAIVSRVDVDSVVAKVDVDAIVDRIDIDAIAATIDLDAVISRLDLARIAEQVIDEIDLVGIIRESSGAMASETVVGVRLQAAEADDRVNRIVDRLLLRRRPPEQGSDDPD
jgi:hypothetical protein